jgi:hypothetical protein
MISSHCRRRLVDAEARRLEALGAAIVRVLHEDGLDQERRQPVQLTVSHAAEELLVGRLRR